MCDKQPTPALPWTNKSAKSALALPQLRLFFGDGADALDSPHMSYAPKLLPQVPFGGAERAAVPARDVRGGFRWFVPQAALDFPGIAHVDGTARVQTCAQHDNPWLHALLVAVEALGGACVLANSSFNTRGRPLLNRFREALQLLDESDDLAWVYFRNHLFAPTIRR